MREFAKYISIGSTIIICFLLPLYIGVKTNHELIGIIIGAVLALSYLVKIIIEQMNNKD